MATTRLTDIEPGEVFIGMPVEIIFRKAKGGTSPENPAVYSYAARPPLEPLWQCT